MIERKGTNAAASVKTPASSSALATNSSSTKSMVQGVRAAALGAMAIAPDCDSQRTQQSAELRDRRTPSGRHRAAQVPGAAADEPRLASGSR